MDLRSLCIVAIRKNKISIKGNPLVKKIIKESKDKTSEDVQTILINLKLKTFNESEIEKIIKKYGDNQFIVTEIIKLYNYLGRYASDKLRDNEEFILNLIKSYPRILRNASPRLKDK